MIFARAVPADLPEIAALEREGFSDAVWSSDAWAAEIDGVDRHVLVARETAADEIVGVATFQVVHDVADLHRVVVRADRQGAGIGRRLVLAGIEWAEAMGAERMLLEVAADNRRALALYRRFGFEPIARRDDYYAAGRPALVMELHLRAPAEEPVPGTERCIA